MAVTTDVVYETGVELVQSACRKLLALTSVHMPVSNLKRLRCFQKVLSIQFEIPEQVSNMK